MSLIINNNNFHSQDGFVLSFKIIKPVKRAEASKIINLLEHLKENFDYKKNNFGVTECIVCAFFFF